MRSKPKVAIIMGSDSDLPIMKGAAVALEELGLDYHLEVVSAHRTPEKMQTFARRSAGRGFKVIIAGAGGAAHLPGMVASLTTLPVIGVPITVGRLKGWDALFSIAQMPKGVPVATMAVDNSYNAGLLAARILALSDARLAAKLVRYRATQKTKVRQMNLRLKATFSAKT